MRVRRREEIEATLDETGHNRRLSFDREMLPYCGKTMRVRYRAERIIDDKTGRMLKLPKDCLVLDRRRLLRRAERRPLVLPARDLPVLARGLGGAPRRAGSRLKPGSLLIRQLHCGCGQEERAQRHRASDGTIVGRDCDFCYLDGPASDAIVRPVNVTATTSKEAACMWRGDAVPASQRATRSARPATPRARAQRRRGTRGRTAPPAATNGGDRSRASAGRDHHAPPGEGGDEKCRTDVV